MLCMFAAPANRCVTKMSEVKGNKVPLTAYKFILLTIKLLHNFIAKQLISSY